MESRKEKLKRLGKSALLRSLWWSLGRRDLVRLGRFLLNESRLDGSQDMEDNGEHALQRHVLMRYREIRPLHVVDVGANIGDWSANLLQLSRHLGVADLHLHCFEPAPVAFAQLTERLQKLAATTSIDLMNAAASSADGKADLHLIGPSTGVNSLYARHHDATAKTLEVPVRSLDSFAAERGIERFALVKCDAEGHDFSVMEGATGLLHEHRIDAFQFEYNWRWVDSRRFLRDVFDLADRTGYHLGKVTGGGVERYARWDHELESFVQGNYLLYAPAVSSNFPAVRWWKDPA